MVTPKGDWTHAEKRKMFCVACPVCNSGIGIGCTAKSGALAHPHMVRVRAALALQRKMETSPVTAK